MKEHCSGIGFSVLYETQLFFAVSENSTGLLLHSHGNDTGLMPNPKGGVNVFSRLLGGRVIYIYIYTYINEFG